ncbi:MAG: hypothetical protein ACMUIM_01855 [bacterium]
MKRGQWIQDILCYLAVLCVIALGLITIIGSGNNVATDNIVLPKDLLVFYGWPSGINNANEAAAPITAAAQEFGKYDYVILGSGLEKTSHVAHTATVQIIAHEDANDTVFFGYIDLGVSTDNHTIAEVKTRVDEWISTGAQGIFLDDFGYDFLVTRERQNEAVSYVHSKGLPVVVNAWNPDHTFGSQYDSLYNPNSVATAVNSTDFYLYESYQIKSGAYETKENWQSKVTKLKDYQTAYNFKILSVTTNDSDNIYDEDKFFYAWYSALLYKFDALGWGEYDFSTNGSAPFRTRPDVDFGIYFMGDVKEDQYLVYRRTDKGLIVIDTNAHEYEFSPT